MAVGVLLLHEGKLPSCADCQRWIHDDKWQPSVSRGKPVQRPPGTPTPCWKCPKSLDKKTPNPGAEMTARHRQALDFYYRVKAGMPMPNDAVVQWYAGLLRWVEDSIARSQASVMPILAGLSAAPVATKSKPRR